MNGWLVVVLCALTGLVSFGAGDALRDCRGKREWTAGYAQAMLNHDVPARVAWAEAAACAEPYDPALNDWKAFDEVPYDQDAAVRDVPPAAGRLVGDDGGGEGASGVLAGSGRAAIETGVMPHAVPEQQVPFGAQVDAPRPGDALTGNLAGPGRSRGYGPYLAAIGRDDPAGWYANLTAPDPLPAPGPPAEPAWLERMLYRGAVSTAWCEARITDAAEWLHEDAAAWDRFAARWCEEARWVLVGARSWPPPSLEAVA